MDAPLPPRTGADDDDSEVVAGLLGRWPEGLFDVVVRDDAGVPVVIRNHHVEQPLRPSTQESGDHLAVVIIGPGAGRERCVHG